MTHATGQNLLLAQQFTITGQGLPLVIPKIVCGLSLLLGITCESAMYIITYIEVSSTQDASDCF